MSAHLANWEVGGVKSWIEAFLGSGRMLFLYKPGTREKLDRQLDEWMHFERTGLSIVGNEQKSDFLGELMISGGMIIDVVVCDSVYLASEEVQIPFEF